MESRRARDEAIIRSLEAAYDAAWTAGEHDAMLAVYTDDAVAIDPAGVRLEGRQALRQWLSTFLKGIARGTSRRTAIQAIRFITPDVAVLDGEAAIARADGAEPRFDMTHQFSAVLIRRGHGWLIAHVRAGIPSSHPFE